MRPRIFALAAGAGICLATAIAQADVAKTTHGQDFSIYEFKDELLNSSVSFPNGSNIRVRPGAYRATLIRPRTNFVPEMLKSVEKM
jgi:hypothetical protein